MIVAKLPLKLPLLWLENTYERCRCVHPNSLFTSPRTVTTGLHASFDKGSWALVPLDHHNLDGLHKFFDTKGKWRKEPRDDGRMKVCVPFFRFFGGIDISYPSIFIVAQSHSTTLSFLLLILMA